MAQFITTISTNANTQTAKAEKKSNAEEKEN